MGGKNTNGDAVSVENKNRRGGIVSSETGLQPPGLCF